MDFSAEDLSDALDFVARQALDRAAVAGPPVDALHLAQCHGIRVEITEPEDEDAPAEYGAPPRRRRPQTGVLELRADQSDDEQHAVAARFVARKLVPAVLAKLGVVPGTENRGADKQVAGLLVPRLLLPTHWFTADARRADFDILALKKQYKTAAFQFLLLRLLDVTDDPMVVAIYLDDAVALRRANRFPATRVLTEAETLARAKAEETNKPARVRRGDWTAWAWPTPGPPFGRFLLRAVPDSE